MRKLSVAVALTFALGNSAFAEPVTFNLDAVKLNELVKIVFSDVLHTGYIADDDFNRDEKTVTVRINNQSPDEVRAALVTIINANGYDLTKQGAFHFITKHKDLVTDPDDLVTFFYQPRYRNVQYISDLVTTVFNKGRFSFQRSVSSLADTPDKSKPSESSTSANAQISKNQDSFLYFGTAKEVEQLKGLLSQVDKPSGEILVKAYLYEVNNTNIDQSAFSAAIEVLNTRFSIGTGVPVLSNAVSFKAGGFEAVYSALSSDSRFKVVSAPSLRVKDRELASFSVGSEVPVLGEVSYQNNGQPVQSVEYKNSGVILDITPTIRAENIELAIRQQLSNFIPTSTGVNGSPTLIKRELSSVVNASDGDVIVLGGLEEQKSSKTKSGFSWLPDFFKGKSDDDSNSDILLVLHVQRL